MSNHADRADLLDLSVLHNEVHRRASAAGLSVKFMDGIATATTDGKTIYIPRLGHPTTNRKITRLRGQVIHEVGHANRDKTIKYAKEYGLKEGQPHLEILNSIEDQAMEKEQSHNYIGDAASLGEGAALHYQEQIEALIPKLKDMKDEDIDDKTRDLSAAYLLANGTRDWDRWSRASREMLEEIMPKKIRDMVSKLRSEGWDKKIKRVRSPDEVWELSKELTKRLFPNEPEPQKVPQDQQGKDGEGKGHQGQPGQEQGGQAGKGKPEKGDSENKNKLHWSMLKHSEEELPEGKKPGGGVDWSGYRGTGQDPMFLPRIFRPKCEKKASPPASTLTGKLRILVQSKARSKFQYDRPTGRLNKRRLGLLAMPVVAGSTAHKRAFKKRVDAKKIDTAVHILVDCSGSMYGEKQEIAAKAADRMACSLAAALRVKVAVTGFGGSGNVPLWKQKEFNDPAIPGVISGLVDAQGGGNADGDAVLYAVETLNPRRESRKMIIVLSDGMPSSAAGGINAYDMLKAAIKTAASRGIELYGIGIQDESVKNFYGANTKVIKTLDEFDQALMGTLAERLVAPI